MKKITVLFSLFLLIAGRTYAQPCSGTPAANTVVSTSTLLCAGGTVTLGLQNPYTSTGITYQWVFSGTSPVGPWTQILAATLPTFATSNNNTGYYSVIIGCSNSQATVLATPLFLQTGSSTATATVPYFEGFEQQSSNTLPNCAWQATNLGTNSLVWFGASNSGVAMAGFSYSPSALGTNTFYSMGLQLKANVMYSVSVYQRTSSFQASNNWSSFGVGVGPLQSSTGATIVTSTAPPNPGTYALRSGTFTVPSDGIYYVQIFGTAVSGTPVASQLYFDDLSVIIPCSNASINLPVATVSPTSAIICSADSALFTFSAGPNTTLGIPGSSHYYSPAFSTTLGMPMTNTLTGCTATLLWYVGIIQRPTIAMVSNRFQLCSGQTATLTVIGTGGASTTIQPGNFSGTVVAVSPSVNTTYTAVCGPPNGCSVTALYSMTVNPVPPVSVVPAKDTVCKGEAMTILAFGANNYLVNGMPTGSIISIPAASNSATYTVTGSSAGNCTANATFVQIVDACTGLDEFDGAGSARVYPVPAGHELYVETSSGSTVQLIDLDAKVLSDFVTESEISRIDLQQLTPGLYLVKIINGQAVMTRKLLVSEKQ